VTGRLRRRLLNLAALIPLVGAALAGFASNVPAAAILTTSTNETCQLDSAKGQIKHVIYVQFDNTHFTRDNPNVPSDLQQMPNLLNFLEGNGVVMTNHHTPLISHTATDILTSFTGLYGDRMGVPVSNSFRYFNPNGTSNLGVSFAYWTDPIFDPTTSTPTDTKFNMITPDGKNTPAPWVPYTRAGCNVGQVATANTVLENIATDIPTVFGPGSPQAQEVASNPGQAFADFVGIGVHCALGNALCSAGNGAAPDLLPDEPGGYSGYNALFGHKYVAPQLSSSPLTDLDGNVIQDHKTPTSHIGFPGFDGMAATVSLSYVAAMQERGIPITYAYISDAHDAHPSGPSYGPGQAGYVAALKAYDTAFGKFFKRLETDGINKSNTLFMFTSDEGDHFAGGEPSPAGCNGVTTPCTYSKIGEVNANYAGLLATEQGVTTPFKVHSDSAPTVYITGNPARDAAVTRTFERATSKLTAVSPITGNTDTITKFLADPVEMKALHMVTADPARTPTFTLFADPNYFLFAAAPACTDKAPCVTENPGFAWNHGDVQPEIVTTWLGMVGPGIEHRGVDSKTWSDHTDIRPTLMVLLGLRDDYSHDGRALTEEFAGWARPGATRKGSFTKVARIYKQLDAAVGQFGLATLSASTRAIESGNASEDGTYTELENKLAALTNDRNALATQMINLLEGAEFGGTSISEQQANQLVEQGRELLERANDLARS
jgi:arylsulfatase A-like enzyme